ncbi:MAG: UDP-N-acetylmuramate dehydrogenase [Bryobacteraceae bacterium]
MGSQELVVLAQRLEAIPQLAVFKGVRLAEKTRFGIGGPADLYLETPCEDSLIEALRLLDREAVAWAILGGGTNVVVADEGFRGAVMRFTGAAIEREGCALVVEAGAELQAVVDRANAEGLQGLETLAGIPGTAGGAVYGNAGAYGHCISECVREVRFWEGERVRCLPAEQCAFDYRESIFKRRPRWVILRARLEMRPGDPVELARRSAELIALRVQKYPPEMKCAGSIFKNLVYDRLPPRARASVPVQVVREGKAPAAWFLEQVGAKGMRRGDICVASYHANLIYNAGAGTARDLCELIAELKRRVRERFELELEEEIRFLAPAPPTAATSSLCPA